ncbi:MAG: peptidoglycan DD-metalloendopeptidase family protein, partial [Proteobacteria bacterium]|nr:peptidoglycan DD-metalloendopeptidase family protein [Pseudomonadota bacterium]
RQKQLGETAELLDRERRRLGALMARKKTLRVRADIDAERASKRVLSLAGEAETLRDLLVEIEKERAKARQKPILAPTARVPKITARPPTLSLAPFSKAQGKLKVPVIGRISGRYGEKTDAGLTRRGVTVSTSPKAQVVAPYDGTVVYAGKFRGYGLLLIIEHGEGYHTLLAGMARLDVDQGQSLVAGEPVGLMEDGDRGQPILYVELRRDGQPINPLPWLAAGKGEING